MGIYADRTPETDEIRKGFAYVPTRTTQMRWSPGEAAKFDRWLRTVDGSARVGELGRLLAAETSRVAELEAELAEEQREHAKSLDVMEAALDQRDEVQAKVTRVEAFSRELRSYCSPHGVSATYADRLDAALSGRDPGEQLRDRLTTQETP